MKYDKDLYQQIDNFLAGIMNPEEHYAFEQEIASNPDLSDEVDVYRQTNEVVKAAASNELRRNIQTGIKAFDRKEKIKKWTIAGLLTLLIAGSVLVYFTSKQAKTKLSHNASVETVEAEVPQQNTAVIQDSILKEKDLITSTSIKPVEIEKGRTSVKNEQVIDETDQDSIIIPYVVEPIEKIETTIENSFPKKTEEQSNAQVIDCSGFKLKTQPEVFATCQDKYEGSIDFTHIKTFHGKEPYTLESSLSNSGKLEKYSNLPAGNYQFTLSDAQGCQENIEIDILEKICRQKKFIINTSIGESWIPPVESSETYDLQIVDIKGKTVFSQNQIGHFEWQGTDNYGQTLPSGLYVYLIKFESGQMHNGQITIIR